jgi:hypothetical protein
MNTFTMDNTLIRKNSRDRHSQRTTLLPPPVFYIGYLFLFAFFFLFPGHACFAQAPVNSPEKDAVFVEVQTTDWSDNGDLVISIRLHASASKGLKLVGAVNILGPDSPNPDPSVHPFSLADSYLLDSYTQAKIPARNEVPNKPYFGPCKLDFTVNLDKGGWMQLGVAFPAPPAPPLAPDGKKQDYKLVLYLPSWLGAKPVSLKIPAR